MEHCNTACKSTVYRFCVIVDIFAAYESPSENLLTVGALTKRKEKPQGSHGKAQYGRHGTDFKQGGCVKYCAVSAKGYYQVYGRSIWT